MALGSYQPQLPFPVQQPSIQQILAQLQGVQGGNVALSTAPASPVGLGQYMSPTTEAVQRAQFSALRGQRLYGSPGSLASSSNIPDFQTMGNARPLASSVPTPTATPFAELPPPPTSTLPPPPSNLASTVGTELAEEGAKKGLLSRAAGGLKGSTGGLATGAAALAGQGYLNREVAPGAGRDLASTAVGGLGAGGMLAGFMPNLTAGGMTSAVAAPAAAVAAGLTLGQALTQPGTDYNVADMMRKSTFQKEQLGSGPGGLFMAPSSSQVTAQQGGSFGDRLGAAIADTSKLPEAKQVLDFLTGNKTDAGSADSTFDLLKKVPVIGGLFGSDESSTPTEAPKDASIGNTDLNSRFDELRKAVLSDNETSSPELIKGMDDLKQVYNTLRATGASDEDAWAAVQQGAVTAVQNEQQQRQSLSQLDAQRRSIENYMKPYADRQQILGNLQSQALGSLASTVGPAYQPVFNYLSQTAPASAQSVSDQFMQQAMAVPTQVQQQKEQATQAQWQNMINQYLLGQQLKGQKAGLANSDQAQQLSQSLAQ